MASSVPTTPNGITLVPVGHVFEMIPGNILGVEVKDNSFGTGNDIYCYPPDQVGSTEPVVIHAVSIEIDKRTTRRVDPGDICGLRAPRSCQKLPNKDWVLFVPQNQSTGASQRDKNLTPRNRTHKQVGKKPKVW